MRISSVVLILIAAFVVNTAGCKVRGKRSVSTNRVVSTRGTADCDCYTCRMKQQDTKDYVLEPAYDETVLAPNDQLPSGSNVVSPEVDSSMDQPVYVTPAPPENTIVEAQPVAQPETTSRQTEIQGEVIENNDLTNELPAEPPVETEVTPDAPTLLNSPEAELKNEPVENNPVVQSFPILFEETTNASNAIAKGADEQPAVDDSVFRVKRRIASTPTRQSQPKKSTATRGHSIWFTPVQNPTQDSPSVDSASIKVTEVNEPIMAPGEVISQPVEPTPAEIVIMAAPKQETQPATDNGPIVLKAQPVDNHMIYNSRPVHAPVREARLTENLGYASAHRQPVQDRTYFHPLPPVEQRWVSPAPAQVNQLPEIDSLPQSTNVQPLPKVPATPEPNQSTLKLHGATIPQAVQAPMARMIQSNNPMLKLRAVPTGAEPQKLPSIVSIQQQQERVFVGSLHATRTQAEAADQRTYGMNRLHTSPWQPIKIGQQGDRQVESSIRRLTIRPQAGSNFSGGTVNR